MTGWITTYRRGDLVIDVLPGESHSAAWEAITGSGPAPLESGILRSRRRRHGHVAAGARRLRSHDRRRPTSSARRRSATVTLR